MNFERNILNQIEDLKIPIKLPKQSRFVKHIIAFMYVLCYSFSLHEDYV
jgi:hypothetical protein